MSTSDMVDIETGSRFPIWWTFGRIQWHVIPKPRGTLHGSRISSTILKIVFRRILFFGFPDAVCDLESGGFRVVFDTLVKPPLATARAA